MKRETAASPQPTHRRIILPRVGEKPLSVFRPNSPPSAIRRRRGTRAIFCVPSPRCKTSRMKKRAPNPIRSATAREPRGGPSWNRADAFDAADHVWFPAWCQ